MRRVMLTFHKAMVLWDLYTISDSVGHVRRVTVEKSKKENQVMEVPRFWMRRGRIRSAWGRDIIEVPRIP